MHTLRVTERTGKDGVLHINLPVGMPDADFEVVLVVQPKLGEPAVALGTSTAGHRDTLKTLLGPSRMRRLCRPPQGELPEPVELD